MNIETFLKYFSRVITLLLVIPLHEAAHGLVAKWLGDDTAERQGRITLNPFAHLDPIGSLLMIFTGFGWAKPVPVNPVRMKKYRAGFALTALAGPVSNLLAAFVAGLIYNIMWCFDSIRYAEEITPAVCVMFILQYIFSINIGLAIFNLIPIPPLDGFNVLRCFTSDKVDRWFYMHQREVNIGFLIFLGVMTYVPYEYDILSRATGAVSNLLWHLVSWIPAVVKG